MVILRSFMLSYREKHRFEFKNRDMRTASKIVLLWTTSFIIVIPVIVIFTASFGHSSIAALIGGILVMLSSFMAQKKYRETKAKPFKQLMLAEQKFVICVIMMAGTGAIITVVMAIKLIS